MSGFTSEALEKRLSELNNSQQSIQTLSLWLIHHRKHHSAIVQTWFKELRKARQTRKLTFMYLANDVIQNSRKKEPEFTKEFASILKPSFENVAKDADEKTWIGLDRILSVWQERNIYDESQIQEFRKAIGQRKSVEVSKNGSKNGKKVEFDKSVKQSNERKHVLEKKYRHEKDKLIKNSPDSKKRKTSSFNSVNTNNLSTNDSGNVDISTLKGAFNGDGIVDPDALVKSLQMLENSASGDAAIREKIASFPPEVSDSSLLEKIQDKEAAERLSRQVEEACTLLADYNNRLTQELEDRKQISNMLATYLKNQRDLLASDEQKLSEYKEKLRKITQVRVELKSHLQNLPDLSLLPSVTGGLAPLPSAGDLFNIAAARAASRNNQSMGSTSSASPNTPSPADYETVSTDTLNS
ncbi:regulation of nuclear pre-mRNA domain-containing protein 1B-like isoform X3 [Dinothrombium tinctorium]|uniref:Regulation of nuclear pre-mRNA domain-containing protein 1B-like isoform X3 n=1 Tax=Dinothrombium tinctorium TaxID=1965070 RepID=A0A443QZG1_9ACAR|nr:regulation of nuclear pre-mRNA domain-containing protein 1B-like isoform X3 [Dinothrombium tinctorium]RWS08409.1 regulation of nuclear pre-mRNA domain-containing protein 1B-like isoform X3 [Dinothrombium tinctorium]